jgi:HTH-type transcriptional regulator/antitoxin MqsA
VNGRFCAGCGSPDAIRFEDETFSVDLAGLTTEVKGLSGWRCKACGEIEFDTESAQRYAAAGDELVLRTREIERTEIRRIRWKLGLSQITAARLTDGGHKPSHATNPSERLGALGPRTATTKFYTFLRLRMG